MSWPRSLPGEEVVRVEDKNRMKVTIWEAAEYLDLTPGKVQDMVERGVLKGRSSPAQSTSLARRWSASSARLPHRTCSLALHPALCGTPE